MNKYMSTFVVGLSVFYFLSALSMDITSEHKDITVEMGILWPQDYKESVALIHTVDLNGLYSTLQNSDFLPSNAHYLQHLLYLSLASRSNNQKTPFSKKQHHKFYMASLIQRSVPWIFFINGVLIIVTGVFPFINFVGLLQCSSANSTSNCLSLATVIGTPTFFSVMSAYVLGFFSLYSTGISTDLASQKADTVQDEIHCLRLKYATLAKYWVDIFYECPEKTRFIANKFDMEGLTRVVQLKTYNKTMSKHLLTPLQEAWYFIQNNNVLPKFTEIECYLYSKKQAEEIRALGQCCTELENQIKLLTKIG